jgi:hypothetical protein
VVHAKCNTSWIVFKMSDKILDQSPYFLTYLLTYLLAYSHSLTHSMVQDILWKADSHSACQTIAHFIYGIWRFITMLTKAHHWNLYFHIWLEKVAPKIHDSFMIYFSGSLLQRYYVNCQNNVINCKELGTMVW